MTQRNIEIMDTIVNELATKSLSEALKTVYVKRTVMIPFNVDKFNVPIEKLNFPTRTMHCLKRTHLNTVNEVVNYCSESGFKKIRNLGANGGMKMFEILLDWCWDHMDINQKTEFLIDTVERNVGNIRA